MFQLTRIAWDAGRAGWPWNRFSDDEKAAVLSAARRLRETLQRGADRGPVATPEPTDELPF